MKLNKELSELPEKWCVKVTNEILDKLIELRKSINRPNPENIKKYEYFVANPSIFNYGGDNKPLHTEITIEQFKQHFMKDKEIIGYKLIKPKYIDAVLKIEGGYSIGRAAARDQILNVGTSGEAKLKEAGVLDLWFEPVYKEAKPELPRINDYEGVFSGDCITYGCAKLNIEWFTHSDSRYIRTIQLNSGIVITEEQMNQIRKVIEYNK